MNSIQPAIAELERAYHGLERLFPRDGVTRRDPAIVIQPSPSGSSVGWLTPRVWKNRRNQEVNDIVICAESLARPVEEIATIMLHEMVHHHNALPCAAAERAIDGILRAPSENHRREAGVCRVRLEGWAMRADGQDAWHWIGGLHPNWPEFVKQGAQRD